MTSRTSYALLLGLALVFAAPWGVAEAVEKKGEPEAAKASKGEKAAVTKSERRGPPPVRVSAVDAKKGSVFVVLSRAGKGRVGESVAKGLRLEVEAGNTRRAWPLLQVDPGLRELNGPKGRRVFDTRLAARPSMRVTAVVRGSGEEKPLRVVLKPESGLGAKAPPMTKKLGGEPSAKERAVKGRRLATAGEDAGPSEAVPKSGQRRGIWVAVDPFRFLDPGESVEVSWDDDADDGFDANASGPFRISLHRDGDPGFSRILEEGEHRGGADVVLPADDGLEPGTDYYIRVTYLGDGDYFGETRAFDLGLGLAALVVVRPAGGERWEPGSIHEVRWRVFPDHDQPLPGAWIRFSGPDGVNVCAGDPGFSVSCDSNAEGAGVAFNIGTKEYSAQVRVPETPGEYTVELRTVCPPQYPSSCELRGSAPTHVNIEEGEQLTVVQVFPGAVAVLLPPPGSYQATCDASLTEIEGTTLSSWCSAMPQYGAIDNGRPSSLLHYDNCLGDISNVDGYLQCDRPADYAPRGSYQLTCVNLNVQAGALQAMCLSGGRYYQTGLNDPFGCQPDSISNQHGDLVCNR